jgi:hypothetical protein
MPQREPAVWVGIIAAVLLALATQLAGNGLISSDLMGTISKALDPTQGGWLLPIVLGLITRFFVSPAGKPGL